MTSYLKYRVFVKYRLLLKCSMLLGCALLLSSCGHLQSKPRSLIELKDQTPWTGYISAFPKGFSFKLDKVARVKLSSEILAAYDTPNPEARLYTEKGELVAYDSDGTDGQNFVINMILPPGQYKLWVQDRSRQGWGLNLEGIDPYHPCPIVLDVLPLNGTMTASNP